MNSILKNKTVGILTLGCKVNQYESEAIGEALEKRGFILKDTSEPCDAYIINTCTVTGESDRKARQFIRRAISVNPNAYIVVTGCMAESNKKSISDIPGVDAIIGNAKKLDAATILCELIEMGRKASPPIESIPSLASAPFEPMSITKFNRTRAYVKIEDGCENKCAYCAIPAARGPVRSKAPEDVIDEVRLLTQNGCREIVLTGIETASYGVDIGRYPLSKLLARVDEVAGVGRIRLGSLDPSLMKETFTDKISDLKNLTPHFHLSMQSGSNKVLALMKRKYNRETALKNIEYLRKKLPEVQLTTDIIVGFPGESEADFLETLDFVKKARFLEIHVFAYSKRKGTLAYDMKDQVDGPTKHSRSARLSALQSEIKNEILSGHVGKTVSVLFETYKKGMASGHTPSFIEVAAESQAPLDGEIRNVLIEKIINGTAVGKIV